MRTHHAMLDALDVAGFVPDRYAVYRPVIARAIATFVDRLPPSRRALILEEQRTLRPGTSRDARLVALLRSCPVLHKLAQVVAREPELDDELRRHLQRLEMGQPRTPWSEVEPALEEALGGAGRGHDLEIEPAPLAEASVAVVVPCRWRASENEARQEGVLKVLKPGVVDRLEEELDILVELADDLDAWQEAYGLPDLGHRATFVTIRDRLRHEVRPAFEQRHLRAAAELYADDERVIVPTVLPFATPKLTAMQRVHGRRVTDPLPPGIAPLALAERVIRTLVATPIFDAGADTMFHADPHAGNLFVTDDGRLALLDWSLVGHLDKPTRVGLTSLVLAALRQDDAAVTEHILGLALSGPCAEALHDRVRAALAELRQGRLPGPAWLIGLLDDVVARGVRFPESLMLFRKVLFTLRGVVADVDPACSVDAVFLAAGLRTLASEWPRRCLVDPFCRDFGTHVSNLDLLRACWASPAWLWPGFASTG